jgi:hypothetical protein
MTADQARTEFNRIVTEELPKVKVKKQGIYWVKATKQDAELSERLSKKLADLHQIMYPETYQ